MTKYMLMLTFWCFVVGNKRYLNLFNLSSPIIRLWICRFLCQTSSIGICAKANIQCRQGSIRTFFLMYYLYYISLYSCLSMQKLRMWGLWWQHPAVFCHMFWMNPLQWCFPSHLNCCSVVWQAGDLQMGDECKKSWTVVHQLSLCCLTPKCFLLFVLTLKPSGAASGQWNRHSKEESKTIMPLCSLDRHSPTVYDKVALKSTKTLWIPLLKG